MANHDPHDDHASHGHGHDAHGHDAHGHADDHGHGHGDDPGEIIPENSPHDWMLRMMTIAAVGGLLVFAFNMIQGWEVIGKGGIVLETHHGEHPGAGEHDAEHGAEHPGETPAETNPSSTTTNP